ncbi:hypothetical protein LGMK_05940 [Leuconostoc sp. C2]|uniref:Uncharacterized protein n=2 Tax=Leuconostoc kimchii TaxID=136609 RepID=D5T3D0_LEUKI|nr:hypothetical protein LKI_06195 [Leuconostoc kimchii IMSNU 11154]AEJ31245.1 hypothetical protein LGMK_05940 [Leuconostoc sp. C2]QBR48331.1 hypothetical protein EW139_09485 [Leuconostoc kimchii]
MKIKHQNSTQPVKMIITSDTVMKFSLKVSIVFYACYLIASLAGWVKNDDTVTIAILLCVSTALLTSQ